MTHWLKRILITLLVLITAGWTTGFYFHKNDSKFRYWWGLPLKNRLLSVQLELERPFIQWLNDEVDPLTYRELSADSLKSVVRLGAQWIVKMQEPSGRFNYWYDPADNKYSSPADDNFLRQAGTNYSLVSAYELLGDSIFLQASYKNLSYLDQFRVDFAPDSSYYMFRQKVKLGGIALPMLVMLKLKELTGDTTYDDRLSSLANMILHLQKAYTTGQYKSTYIYYGDFEYEKNSGWESNIYPGEAMLALTEMYRAFKDSRYLASLDQAYEYYSAHGRWKHFSFMPWATIAMSRLAALTNEMKYAEFTFEMTDRILYWQNLNEDRNTYGSLFGVPTVFTATWIEGVAEAYKLALQFDLYDKREIYYNRSMVSYKWLLQLQISHEVQIQNGYDQAALGGFSRSLIEPVIRIDNTQHAISAIIKMVETTSR